jgi:hypothetical protein
VTKSLRKEFPFSHYTTLWQEQKPTMKPENRNRKNKKEKNRKKNLLGQR